MYYITWDQLFDLLRYTMELITLVVGIISILRKKK